VARNVVKAVLLHGGLVALLGALGWWAGELRLAAVFAAVGLLIVGTVLALGSRALLASMGARELPFAAAPLAHSTAERLAQTAGVARPRLYLLDDGYPRSLSVGRGAGDVGIALSRGLLAMSLPDELEGVLAHEIAHARLRDTTIQTPVVLLALWLVEASRIGGRLLQRALLVVLAPLASSLVHIMLSPKRELGADLFAAGLSASPHGLADALTRLEQAMELVEFRGSPVTEPLHLVDPFGADRLAALFKTHPRIDDRVHRLRSLDPEWAARAEAA
jgi:heat shock protein HtpX